MISRFLLVLFVAIAVTRWMCLAGIERDPIISRIEGTKAGELNAEFYFNRIRSFAGSWSSGFRVSGGCELPCFMDRTDARRVALRRPSLVAQRITTKSAPSSPGRTDRESSRPRERPSNAVRDKNDCR
jgi:hypothetical protein